jgi:glycosyltransferase involved in cell wall biosynthesis
MDDCTVHFAVPGALDSPTGGYGYARELIAHLSAQGWQVRHLALPAAFPRPDPAALAVSEAALAALPEGALVLVDGLAFGALDAMAARQSARLRLVALVHHPLADETGLSSEAAARLRASERAALSFARAVICTSDATARRLVADFGVPPERLHVAPPGTAPGARATGSGDAARPVILSVGSLTPRKGHDALIAALGGIAALPWRLRIVGAPLDPGTAQALAAQVRDCGLENRVALTGALPDLTEEYLGADLFALATRYEGYGMALAEALSHGLPVVATRTGAAPDLVPSDAGRLVEVDDIAALRAALAGLLSDPAARAAAAAAAWRAGRTLPRWPATAATVARVLGEVQAGAGAP